MIILCENFNEFICDFAFRSEGQKIGPAWKYAANGIMWRLLAAATEYFVGEDRNIDRKHATFESSKPIFKAFMK